MQDSFLDALKFLVKETDCNIIYCIYLNGIIKKNLKSHTSIVNKTEKKHKKKLKKKYKLLNIN